jgi:hypothetical protein
MLDFFRITRSKGVKKRCKRFSSASEHISYYSIQMRKSIKQEIFWVISKTIQPVDWIVYKPRRVYRPLIIPWIFSIHYATFPFK